MPYAIEIKGLDEMRKMFEQSPQIVGDELGKATKKAGIKVQTIEIKEAPHKTGALQRSIKLSYVPIVATIMPMVDYAYWVHKGTSAHDIIPKVRKALKFKTRDGKVVFAKRVNHPGTKENKFVERTRDIAEDDVNSIFQNALTNIIQRLSI